MGTFVVASSVDRTRLVPITLMFALAFFLCIFASSLAAEQTLIIDFEKKHPGFRRGDGRKDDFPAADEGDRGGVHHNSVTIERAKSRVDVLPESVKELKELVRQLDSVFSRRFEQLSKRLDRLEANQMNFRDAAMSDWAALSLDKRIKLFTRARHTWRQADAICRAHSGNLLQIDSEQENQQTFVLLTGSEGIFWIGAQTSLSFNIPIGNYSNFDMELGPNRDEGREQGTQQRCVAISTKSQGRWLSRECTERHGFVCQI